MARTSRSTTSTSTTFPRTATSAWLYKYPMSAYPYDDLVRSNRERSRDDMEYELVDTGIFDRDRVFRRRGGVRKVHSRGHCVPDHRAQSLRLGGFSSRATHLVVPQHMVLVSARRQAADLEGRAGDACRWHKAPGDRRPLSLRRGGRRVALLRQRDQHGTIVGRRRLPAIPERRHRGAPDTRVRIGQPSRDRYQSCGPSRPRDPRG